ncbi:unnamed protein product [Adineta ricciae]|uniref:Early endosome antigen 1 n=1 Tax=Adineta ricciae TaxID=249248 RepID=A0A813T468_ADIRI|nr:unnamed protein product [Adineta ricciae]CAF1417179.1 unnamed protein product [Adineta ricciae]
MSNFLNRIKNLKTGMNNGFSTNESDTGSICSFDEEGFICPMCHRKFPDTAGLERHFLQAHAEPQPTTATANHGESNGTRNDRYDDPHQEVAIWKQQFCQSEESRMQLSSDLMQQRQRVGDLEEEMELLRKQLRTTQMKVVEQSQEIGNLKATKDVYDAQIAMFTDELLNTQGELKEKQNQVDTLCNDLIPRPTNDDVDVLKRELIAVQQRMNEMSLEKELQIENLRSALSDISKYAERLNQIDNTFDQNMMLYDQIINDHTSQIDNDLNQVKQFVQVTRERKSTIVAQLTHMRQCLSENQTEIDQLKKINEKLHLDLEQRKQINEQLTDDLHNEQNTTTSNRMQIEKLTSEIQEFEKALDELKDEKKQLLLSKMDGDADDERQNLVRQLTQEKDQYEQKTKDSRKQIKQINKEKDNLQKELNQISIQLTERTNEKNQLQEEQTQLNNQLNSLKQQLDDLNKEKERQIDQLRNELNSAREEHVNQQAKLENEHKELILQLEKDKSDLQQHTLQQDVVINITKLEIETLKAEKDNYEQQISNNQQAIDELQQTVSQLNVKLNEKDTSITRISVGIRRSIDFVHKTHEYIQQTISPAQVNMHTMIEEAEKESQVIRTQTLEDMRNEYMNYITVVHTMIADNRAKLDKQMEEDRQHAEQQMDKIKDEHRQLVEEYDEQKRNLETQLSESNQNFVQISESLSETIQSAKLQQEKSEQQITALEHELADVRSDLESRAKKYEMQSLALRENLGNVRGELKAAQEKLAIFEKLKSEKADLEAHLLASQEERQRLLERSITSETRNEKLLLENGQLAKKNSDLESALQEIAREYQGLQIHTNKLTQRRWINDSDVHNCMKCGQTFTMTQRKHHCRSCGNIFCDTCSSKTAVVAASSKKAQRVCDQCYQELTS